MLSITITHWKKYRPLLQKVTKHFIFIYNVCLLIYILFTILIDDAAAIISLAPALGFNGGGHINHSFFWESLTPNSTKRSSKFVIMQIIVIFFTYLSSKNKII